MPDPYVVNPKASIFCLCKSLRDKAKLAATEAERYAYQHSLLTVLDQFGINSGHPDYFLLRHGN